VMNRSLLCRPFCAALGLSAVLFAACSSDDTSELTDAGQTDDSGVADSGTEDGGVSMPPNEVALGGDRPARMRVPATYDGSAFPLVILLHGYTSNSAQQDAYFGLSNLVDSRSFFLILPDGTREQTPLQNRFWNATDACCDFTDTNVDDVGYLLGLVDEASAQYNIDPNRVMAVGHSNGGFMAYRLACDASTRIAAVASLAGATFDDEADCSATSPVSVLQVHGTQDTTIRYDGGNILGVTYPSAEETVEQWATRAGCSTTATPGDAKDLDRGIDGNDTDTFVYADGCDEGIEVQLWRINGGGHVPPLTNDFAEGVVDFLLSHPKP
ncbi:MAG: PHB depolymerase family esterase, partial [Myxococcota bacterium]